MRILFLTLLDFGSFDERNIYTDLLREFKKNGHDVYCISPSERRTGIKTHFEENGHLLKVKIGNTQKTNIVEKGLSTLMIEYQFISAIRKYFADTHFELILYSTPPITFANVVKFLKQRDNATTYLMLKDIFPQNAVDIGLMQTKGIKGLIYRYFRKKEIQLYSLSERIGCMSQANAEYILKHNPEIVAEKIEICPNCIEMRNVGLSEEEKMAIRDQYDLPQGKKLFVYGGNLGKPQDVPFIVECLRKCAELEDVFFVIAGSGTERHVLEKYVKKENPLHVKLLAQLPKREYDNMVACCDIGLIFLDHQFTIPNFPSRLLSYMQAGLPVLASTDTASDIGKVAVEGKFGWWCESNDASNFARLVSEIIQKDCRTESAQALSYLAEHYNTAIAYDRIVQGVGSLQINHDGA